MRTTTIVSVVGVAALCAAALTQAPVRDFVTVGGGTQVVADDFTRTVGRGWDSAVKGGTYTVSDPANASVGDGSGKLALVAPGSSMTAQLTGVSAADVDTRVTFALPQDQAGGDLYFGVVLRKGAQGSYRAKVRVLPGGTARLSFSRTGSGGEALLGGETQLPIRLGPGRKLNLQVRIDGTDKVSLMSRAWLSDVVPPSSWQHGAVDASAQRLAGKGTVGLWSHLSRSAAPTTLQVSSFSADSVAQTPGEAPVTVAPTAASSPSASSRPSAGPSTSASPKPAPTAPSIPVPAGGRKSVGAGSAPVGSSRYAIPARSVIVSTSGSDDAAGTTEAPVRTIAKAVALAPSGGTVVLRAGVYHETLTVPASKSLTVQAYPGEAVWLDGSVQVTGWRAEGSAWVHDGWTAQFDHSPTYAKGASDGTADAWKFLNPSFPMAAHPDLVFVDGKPLKQVASAGEVTGGTFFADYAAKRLYVGQNPDGHEVRASDLSGGVNLNAPGSALRGVGVRRYATPVPGMGTVKITGRDSTVENVLISDVATTGLSALAPHVTVRNVTVRRAGMLGFHANYADDLQLLSVRAEGNNTEHFNSSPVSGGIKVTRLRGIAIVDSVSTGNTGKGIWLDESVYDATVLGNDVKNNSNHGISWEISAKAVFADNVITGNGGDGLRVNDSSGGEIWNNTITGNGRTLNLVQDARRGDRLSDPGHDPRQKQPDPTMTWLVGDIRIGNNVLGAAKAGANCVLCVEDYSHERTAAQMRLTVDGNVYHRPDKTPKWLVVWSRGPGDPDVFTTLAAFQKSSGQEDLGAAPAGPVGKKTTPAVPLPAPVARLIGSLRALASQRSAAPKGLRLQIQGPALDLLHKLGEGPGRDGEVPCADVGRGGFATTPLVQFWSRSWADWANARTRAVAASARHIRPHSSGGASAKGM